jgi:hypothetical protein
LAHVLVGEQRFALANRIPPSGQARGHASPEHALANIPAILRSRLNQIEHCFGPITKKRIGRGVLKCVDERQAAISR